jgi:membrane-bound ClpP family serine protease
MIGWLIMTLFAIVFLALILTVTGYAHLAERGVPAMLLGLLFFAASYYSMIGETVMAGLFFLLTVVCTLMYIFYEPIPHEQRRRRRRQSQK